MAQVNKPHFSRLLVIRLQKRKSNSRGHSWPLGHKRQTKVPQSNFLRICVAHLGVPLKSTSQGALHKLLKVILKTVSVTGVLFNSAAGYKGILKMLQNGYNSGNII